MRAVIAWQAGARPPLPTCAEDFFLCIREDRLSALSMHCRKKPVVENGNQNVGGRGVESFLRRG